MPKVLNMLCPGINLPAKISNLTRKVKKYNGDLSVAIEGIQPQSVLEYIGNYCQEAGLKLLHLKNGSIEYHIHPKYVTNGLIYELEKYRRSKNLPRRSIIQWTSRFFPQSALQNPNPDAHYHAWTSLYTQVTRQTHDATKVKSDTDVSQAHLQGYLSQLFIFPEVQASPSEQMTSALSNPPTEKIQSSAQPLLAIAKYQGEVFGKYVQQTDAKLDRHSRKIHHLQNEVKNREQQHDHMKKLLRNLEVQKDEVEKDRQHLTKKLKATRERVEELQTVYKPRNVKWREETKEKQKMQLKYKVEKKAQEIKSLKGIVEKTKVTMAKAVQESVQQATKLTENVEKLQEKVITEKTLKLRAQKVASKWRRKEQTEERNVSKEIEELNDEVIELQNENADLRDQLQAFLDDDEIASFENGKYKDDVRQVYYSLINKGISIRNIESTIRTVLKNLAGKKIGRLPQKSLSAEMMVECQILSDQQVGKVILEGPNNTLHLDGTRKKFKEFASFQVTTGDGSKGLSMGFQDMASGSADDYMEATKNTFYHIAQLLLPKGADHEVIDGKQAKLLEAFKNVQSDRHIVNKSYMTQLKEYRYSFLPHCIEHFHSLGAEEVENIVQMNHLFCGMHAIHGMGTVCKDAIKEFESLAVSQITTYGFNKQNARSYDILYEISKALTTGHGCQKAGVVLFLNHTFTVEV